MSAVPIAPMNDPLREMIGKVDQLAVLPHVVYKVLELSSSNDSPIHEMEKAITVDPGFSSKVLVMANSAYFGLPKRVTSIKEALMFLGFKTVRSLAMTVGVFDLFVGKTDRESLRRRGWWRLSVDSAICARWIANKTKTAVPDDAYTCGLLHLIGKTLLDRVGGQDYHLVTERVEAGANDVDAEFEVYGLSHQDLAIAAAAKWGFPEVLHVGMRYLTPEHPDHPLRSLQACVALGHAIANRISKGAESDPEGNDLPDWALETLGLQESDRLALIQEGHEMIAAAQLAL